MRWRVRQLRLVCMFCALAIVVGLLFLPYDWATGMYVGGLGLLGIGAGRYRLTRLRGVLR